MSKSGARRYLGNVPITSNVPSHARIKPNNLDHPESSGTSSASLEQLEQSLRTPDKLEMKHWGLPELVQMRYRQKGITTMFQWQMECLTLGSVLEGGNLVYSAPTSAGKTLVAEMLLIKRVLETKKKGIFILPFVSLAREKMFGMQDLLKDLHVRVFGFMGSQSPPGGLKRADIAVCTIEKANSLINRLLEEGNLADLGCVVVDELHLLGDPSRGYLLELLLTKIRYMSYKQSNCDIQIIGMSATLPNIDLLATWLDADLYKTDFRPVPLSEHIKVGRSLFNNNFDVVRNLSNLIEIPGDAEDLSCLCLETLLDGHSVLIFCPTKNWCEKLAVSISRDFFRIGSGKLKSPPEIQNKLRHELKANLLGEVIEQLKRCPAGLDENLAKSISFGVSYHHAGLTFDERDIIEGSFKRGALRVLIATSTLSSGVNLPARRVIVRCPFTYQNQLIDTLSYKQMVGRAGRKGVDTEGESILICRENEKAKVAELVTSDLKPVQSCLVQGGGESAGTAMKRAILEVISSGAASTPEEVEKYSTCTMLAASLLKEQKSSQETNNSISSCITFLEENEFVRLQSHTDENGRDLTRYTPTQLGMACLASSLSPDEGIHVFAELQKARKCFVLENELHIIYQVVPIYAAVSWPNLDWMNFLSLYESLSVDMKRVGDLVGVEERFLVRAMRGTISKTTPKQMRILAIHQRFYTALALNDLVNEVPLRIVSEKYGASKGMLQSLQQAASTFAGMVTVFCHKLGWSNLELLLGQFQDRLQFGVQRELIDLCRLNTLNGQRARILYNAKLENVATLANASVLEVENILQNAAPFESEKQADDESAREANKRSELRSFWVTGQKGLTIGEAAKVIVEEARDVLQKDLGITISFNSSQDLEDNKSLISPLQNSKSRKKSNSKKTKKKTVNSSFRSKNYVPKNPKRLSIEEIKQADAKIMRRSLEQKSPKDPIHSVQNGCETQSTPKSSKMQNLSKIGGLTPVSANQNTPASSKMPKTPISATKYDLSFDLSGQMEEIFEIEGDDIIQSRSSAKKSAKRHHQENGGASPNLKLANNSVNNEDEIDVFADSFGNSSELDLIMNDANDAMKKEDLAKKVAETSCPKTPNLTVCNSEPLMLSDKTKLESIRCSKNALDSTLSDSFLERAMNTHMSEDQEMVVEAALISQKPIFPTTTPLKFVQSPKSSRQLSDTPNSDKSYKLAKRRKQTQRTLRTNKISPGLLILSDSESDNLFDSPINDINMTQNETATTSHQEELQIVDVCTNRELFRTFCNNWRNVQNFSMALACAKPQEEKVKRKLGIGARLFSRNKNNKKTEDKSEKKRSCGKDEIVIKELGISVIGLAVSWPGALASYYISFSEESEDAIINPLECLTSPNLDPDISLSEKIDFVQSMLDAARQTPVSITVFDSKEHTKLMCLAMGINLSHKTRILDPKVASWMLEPMEKEKNLANMVMNLEQGSVKMLGILGSANGCGSVALNAESGRNSGRLRAVAESILVLRVMDKLQMELEKCHMWKAFRDIEMRSQVCLAHMELNGVGFSTEESEKQRKIISCRMDEIQNEAYQMAGHQFSLTAPDEICKVLYDELKLPINGDPSLSRRPSTRSAQTRVRGSKSNYSSSKDILIKLKRYHELPGLILEWRKLNMSITKVVFPMNKAKTFNPELNMDRIYTNCKTHTATGRISLHEPNIQNIPRDFEIRVNQKLIEEALGTNEWQKIKSFHEESSRSLLLASYVEESEAADERNYCVSMRHSIVACKGFLILAADYSQLELRILAHLSKDERLRNILNQGKDVFKSIAASWKKTDIDSVDDEERQQAKQICYGMIYGIGTKSLGENLGLVEEEASVFLSDFRLAYPDIKKYMDKVLVDCRKVGYVETMMGRRRYLPKITGSANQFARSAAERQAINTTIQGSAADLVKSAMNEIEKRLHEAFPSCRTPLRPKASFLNDAENSEPRKGAFFLLQMHDELIYEVCEENVAQVASIVKMVMENCCKLSVKTPVKIKLGQSWGKMSDMKDL